MPDEQETKTEGFANRPATIKAGHGVQVKTWTNHGQHGDYESISIERSHQTARTGRRRRSRA